MSRKLIAFTALSAVLGLLMAVHPASAQFGGLKKKVKEKVERKTDEKTDKAVDKAIDKATGEGGSGEAKAAGGQENASGGSGEAGGAVAPAGSNDFSLYKKYDFVPGDKVIMYDDLSREEMGEFPSRWKLDRGVFEVAESGGEKWIVCSDDGAIMPKTNGVLPDKYTVELEFYDHGQVERVNTGHWLDIVWLDGEGNEAGWFRASDHRNTELNVLHKQLASKSLTNDWGRGVHTMRIMATKSTIKCFVDNERVANVPQTDGFHPVGFQVRVDLWNESAEKYPMMFRNFRFAEGGKTMREQLDETGRIVTHGILFTSGSAEIRAESYKTLADIGSLLTSDAALRLSVEGHTDSDGQDAANQKLSEARAASVRDYLVKNFQVAGDRLESKGFGETKPIDTNDTPEGKANNRRVELVKL